MISALPHPNLVKLYQHIHIQTVNFWFLPTLYLHLSFYICAELPILILQNWIHYSILIWIYLGFCQAYVLQERGSLSELVDPELGSEYSSEEAMVMLNVALSCKFLWILLQPISLYDVEHRAKAAKRKGVNDSGRTKWNIKWCLCKEKSLVHPLLIMSKASNPYSKNMAKSMPFSSANFSESLTYLNQYFQMCYMLIS